ncbi:MAG: BMP family ABC transporter substrate-binding protein [Oscillospiraceae bacterium]|jgi:basic membrane protein A|nr:BMP family ABC transporter substrate-binding protein [Oscillospiraceae bacterium]
MYSPHRRRNVALLVSSLIAIPIIFSGCSSSKGTTDAKNVGDNTFSAAMVMDVGGISDKSFNQSAYEDGLKQLEAKLGAKIGYRESPRPSDYKANLEKATDEKNNIIWGVGYKLAESIESVAKENPTQQYGIIDHEYPAPGLPNVISICFKDNQAAFLIGYLSGVLSKTGSVGFIGGMGSVVIERFEVGFKAGVALAEKENNSKVKVFTQYAESYTDPTKCKDVATGMYTNGCDIIYCAAGQAGVGAREAAKERNLYIMGVDLDQSKEAPENVLASSLKNVGKAMFDETKKIYSGEVTGIQGGNRVLGLEEMAVGIAFGTTNLTTDDVKEKIENVKSRIISGEVFVPSTKLELEEQAKPQVAEPI